MSPASISEQAGSHVKPFTTPTIPNSADWVAFRCIITYLYQECDLRLQDVIDTMLHEFNFRATKRMYTQRFRDWNVAKNIVSHDVQEYLQRSKNSAELTSPNGSSSVMLRGRIVRVRKLLNHMKRRKILHEAEPDQADIFDEDSLETRNASSEDKDKCYASLANTMDEVSHQECERVLEKDEMSIELISEELTSLSIAILQTDFHYRGNDEETTSNIEGNTEREVPHQLLALSPSQVLAGPPELCDLAFILHHFSVVYAQFPNTRNPSSPQPFQLAARQQSQAKDMYARHWLAVSLSSKGAPDRPFELILQNDNHFKLMMSECHPHFLPWIAFVVCYTWSPRNRAVSMDVLGVSYLSTKTLPENDPRRQILERLRASNSRRSICLVLLRKVISTFQRELQSSHMQSLDLLARLFDTIEIYEYFNSNLVEETLRRWAESSLTIAKVIREEKRTARMKDERDAIDPVHHAAASNRNSAASFGQDQGLFTGT